MLIVVLGIYCNEDKTIFFLKLMGRVEETYGLKKIRWLKDFENLHWPGKAIWRCRKYYFIFMYVSNNKS